MLLKISTRDYRPEDTQYLVKIYYNTLHKVNIRDYSQEQLDCWAPPASLELEGWYKKFSETKPIIACVDQTIVGFVEFELNGHIDCFFCHHDWVGRGVGTVLMSRVHEKAEKLGIGRLFSEVSLTARSFFEKHGFLVRREHQMARGYVDVLGYEVEKYL